MGFGRENKMRIKLINTNLILALFVFGFVFPFTVLSAVSEENNILNVFNAYKRALKTKNGVQAATLVSTQTMNYYENLRKNVLDANAEEMKTLPIMEAMTVLILRHHLSASELRRMDGKQLFIHSVNQGWVSENSVENVRLGEVTVKGNVAIANVISRGKKRKNMFPFSKQQGAWKLDLGVMMNDMGREMDAGFRRLAQTNGMSEQELVEVLVEKATGMKVTSELWQRPSD